VTLDTTSAGSFTLMARIRPDAIGTRQVVIGAATDSANANKTTTTFEVSAGGVLGFDLRAQEGSGKFRGHAYRGLAWSVAAHCAGVSGPCDPGLSRRPPRLDR
jgi:hypothetical protein